MALQSLALLVLLFTVAGQALAESREILNALSSFESEPSIITLKALRTAVGHGLQSTGRIAIQDVRSNTNRKLLQMWANVAHGADAHAEAGALHHQLTASASLNDAAAAAPHRRLLAAPSWLIKMQELFGIKPAKEEPAKGGATGDGAKPKGFGKGFNKPLFPGTYAKWG